jgi:hypothetical protein
MRQSTPTSALLMNLGGAAPELLYHDVFFEANPRFGGDYGVLRPLPDIPECQIAAVTLTF